MPAILPTGIAVWGDIRDRFPPRAYYPTATSITIEGNDFRGEFSGPGWQNRQAHVSPQGCVTIRAISLDGVEDVVLRGNSFPEGNVTDNTCACCSVVDTFKSRCAQVRTLK